MVILRGRKISFNCNSLTSIIERGQATQLFTNQSVSRRWRSPLILASSCIIGMYGGCVPRALRIRTLKMHKCRQAFSVDGFSPNKNRTSALHTASNYFPRGGIPCGGNPVTYHSPILRRAGDEIIDVDRPYVPHPRLLNCPSRCGWHWGYLPTPLSKIRIPWSAGGSREACRLRIASVRWDLGWLQSWRGQASRYLPLRRYGAHRLADLTS